MEVCSELEGSLEEDGSIEGSVVDSCGSIERELERPKGGELFVGDVLGAKGKKNFDSYNELVIDS